MQFLNLWEKKNLKIQAKREKQEQERLEKEKKREQERQQREEERQRRAEEQKKMEDEIARVQKELEEVSIYCSAGGVLYDTHIIDAVVEYCCINWYSSFFMIMI